MRPDVGIIDISAARGPRRVARRFRQARHGHDMAPSPSVCLRLPERPSMTASIFTGQTADGEHLAACSMPACPP